MDPRNFLDESQIFMFESQAYDSSQSRNVVAGILDGTFMEDGNGYYYNGSFKTYVDTFMEAGAIAHICSDFGIPFVSVKSISNMVKKGGEEQYTDCCDRAIDSYMKKFEKIAETIYG